MATAIQKPEARGQSQDKNIDDSRLNHSGMTVLNASRFTNDASRVLCDPEFQSCYTSESQVPPLFTPATKVIAGVLGAAGSFAVGMASQGGDSVTDSQTMVKLAEGALREGNKALAARRYVMAADRMGEERNEDAVPLYRRALEIRDGLFAWAKRAEDPPAFILETGTPLSWSPERESDLITFQHQSAQLREKLAGCLVKLGRMEEAIVELNGAYDMYLDLRPEMEKIRMGKDDLFQRDQFAMNAPRVAVAISDIKYRMGDFEGAASAAIDAASLRGIFLLQSDFTSVDASPFHDKLAREFALARIYDKFGNREKAAEHYLAMSQVYAEAGSRENVAWALAEGAGMLREADRNYEAWYLSSLSGVMYFQAATPVSEALDLSSLDLSRLIEKIRTGDRGELFESLKLDHLYARQLGHGAQNGELLESSAQEFFRAAKDAESLLDTSPESDLQVRTMQSGFLGLAADALNKLGEYGEAAEMFRTQASVLSKIGDSKGLVESLRKAIEMYGNALEKIQGSGKYRDALVILFEMETVTHEAANVANEIDGSDAERAEFQLQIRRLLEVYGRQKRKAALKIGLVQDGSPTDIQDHSIGSYFMGRLARGVQLGSESSFREFIRVAAETLKKTPGDVVVALQTREGDVYRDVSAAVRGNRLLLDALAQRARPTVPAPAEAARGQKERRGEGVR